MKKKAITQAAALLACTVAVTSFSWAVSGNFAKEESQSDVAEETTELSNITAGVTTLLNAESIHPVTLSAGISDSMMDFSGSVDVAQNEKQIVAAAKEETETVEEEKTDTTFCGYENLGIANVSETLNVRKKATTDSEIVGKMTKNAACEVIKIKDGWAKIESGKVKGYVKAEYLLTGEKAMEVAKDEVITIAKVETDTLRVRKKASTDSAILSLVGAEEELTVLSEKKGWVKVEVDNEKGYISTDYVTLSEKLPTAQSMKELKYGEGVTDVRVDLVSYALQFVGNRYVWGGTSLTNGVDCSGFTMQIYAKYGVSLPHSSKAQPSYGRKISSSEAQPGDLFFYGSGSSISHVAIYIGNGQIVHASNSRDGIKISNAFYRSPICVVRYLD